MEAISPLKAIREKCLDCMGGQASEIKLCPCGECPLYLFRFGKNPNMQHQCTAAQVEALRKGRRAFQCVDNLAGKPNGAAAEYTYTPEGLGPQNPVQAPTWCASESR